jgi:hypothetical protein
MVKALALCVVLAACQGGDSAPPAPKKAEASPTTPTTPVRPPAPDAPEAEPKDPVEELGAIPAWDAVVDRAQYLERRGQHGVVYGVLGAPIMMPAPPPAAASGSGTGSGSGSAIAAAPTKPVDAGVIASPYTWLVDETEGNGALAIRARLGNKQLSLKEGDRVALGGAWALDETRHWFWKVDNAQVLPAARPPKPDEAKDAPQPPGHTLVTGNFPPGVKRISVGNPNDLVYFQVVGAPPTVDGDGWPVADELGNPVVALLVLPGERASYGAQDMRTPDERWQLRRGQTYWVRLGRYHKRGPDKPQVYYARTAPVWVR